MRVVPFLVLGSLLAGCSSVPAAAPQRTAEQQAKFMRLTNGLVAGASVSCLPSWQAQDLTYVDGRTAAFRPTPSSVTMVNLTDGCELLASGSYAMQTNTSGMGLCTGDIVRVVDVSSPAGTVGSCSVASIIPYSKLR